MSKILQQCQIGFHFTLGSVYKENADYDSDRAYFEQCVPAVQAALSKLPCWNLTIAEEEDPMVIHPYSLCQFDSMIEEIDGLVTVSFWVMSERVTLVPKEDGIAMRDAMLSVMAAQCVKVELYTEVCESKTEPMDL